MKMFRSLVFTPASNVRRMEKAFTLGADVVILDLEDACAASEKEASRLKASQVLTQSRPCLGYIRINSLSTRFAYGDLAQVVWPGLDGIVLPKVEASSDLLTIDWIIRQLECDRKMLPCGVDLIPIIETALGMSRLGEILRATPRVKRASFGAGDFTFDLGLAWSHHESELMPYRSQMVLQSRAAGIEPPIDTVWTDLKDTDGFAVSVNNARDSGFQGKLCIHPDQIDIVNRAYIPSTLQVQQAQRIVDAFAQAEAAGKSAIQLDGQFIDYPIFYRASRILSVARMLRR